MQETPGDFPWNRRRFLKNLLFLGPAISSVLTGCEDPESIRVQSGESLGSILGTEYNNHPSYDERILAAYRRLYHQDQSALDKNFLDSKKERFMIVLQAYLHILPQHKKLRPGERIHRADLNALIDDIIEHPEYWYWVRLQALGYTPPPSATKKKQPESTRKKLNIKQAIALYAPYAIEEMQAYDIPASITLAQCIIESEHGNSYLAGFHNYFGIKCSNPKHKDDGAQGHHCVEQVDDHDDDRFLVFPTIASGFRAHSLFLEKDRYKVLQKSNPQDFHQLFQEKYRQDAEQHHSIRQISLRMALQYRNTPHRRWAWGLRAMGYATQPNYAASLLQVIAKYGLTKYDRI